MGHEYSYETFFSQLTSFLLGVGVMAGYELSAFLTGQDQQWNSFTQIILVISLFLMSIGVIFFLTVFYQKWKMPKKLGLKKVQKKVNKHVRLGLLAISGGLVGITYCKLTSFISPVAGVIASEVVLVIAFLLWYGFADLRSYFFPHHPIASTKQKVSAKRKITS
jgi:hypothetical protein